ncbi:MAG: hypothetical protein WAV32_02470 [Halobacteriota archaeon]
MSSTRREEPTLGRAIAMKEFIFVNGVNVRKLIDDLEYLILLNVSRIPIPIHEICNAVELSNYLKRKTRIVEASYTRVENCDCENYIGTTWSAPKTAAGPVSISRTCPLYQLFHDW